ncbi:MAG: hypothetical protein QM705_05625 [Ancrocorticia sp.]
MKRTFAVLSAALSVALALTACGSTNEDTAKESAAPSVEMDSREFFLVGSGKGPELTKSDWGKVIEDEHKLAKSETSNEYTITLDLYVGDEFQFAVDSDWNDQRGAGYLAETEKDGEAYFADSEGAGLNDDPNKANIKVEKEGNYTLVLTTDPANADNDKIEWTWNGEAAEAIDYATLDLYIKGSVITGWKNSSDEVYKMTSFLNGAYSYKTELVAGDEIIFYSFEDAEKTRPGGVAVNGTTLDVEASTENVLPEKNFTVTKNGTYTFDVDLRTGKTVAKYDPAFTGSYEAGSDWFILGSGMSKLLFESNYGGFSEIGDQYRLTPVEGTENEYAITLDLQPGDQFAIVANQMWAQKHGFKNVAEPSKDGVEYFTNARDLRVNTGGNYTLTLVIGDSYADNKIEWVRNGDVKEPLGIDLDVVVKSSEKGWDPAYGPFTTSAEKATFELDLAKDEAFTFHYFPVGITFDKIDYKNPGRSIQSSELGDKGAKNGSFGTDKDFNFIAKEAGKYKVTIDFSSGGPVVDFD